MKKIRKAVFPGDGCSTCFLLATKAMLKKLLFIVGKPLIQYAQEEEIVAGINTMIRKRQSRDISCVYLGL